MMAACLTFISPVSVSADSVTDEICKSAGSNRPAVCDDKTNIDSTVKNTINTIIGIVGLLSVVMIVYGGFLYTSSAGSPDKIKTAKSTILYAIVGLVVAILAFVIVQFVLNQF